MEADGEEGRMELRKVGQFVFEDPFPNIHWAKLVWRCPKCKAPLHEPNELELTAAAQRHLKNPCPPRNLRNFPRAAAPPAKQKAEKQISAATRWAILKRDGFKCKKCGKTQVEERIEVDHITPRSKGGTNDESNLEALCLTCNRGKSDSV